MYGLLNKKISTWLGILLLLFIAGFVAAIVIRQYKRVMEIRFDTIELEIFGKDR